MHLEDMTDTSQLKVKLLSGASVVKIKPLFSYDSKCLIVASGSDVKVYNIQSGVCIHTLRHHKKRVASLQENKNNSLQVFSCSEDGVIVRWDYAEGIKLQVHDLQMPVASFYTPNVSSTWFATRKTDNLDEYRLYSFIPKGSSKFTDIKMILHPVIPRENAIAFGHEGNFIASVYESALHVYEHNTKKTIRHFTGERKLTCVACHPTDFVVATGDDQGRVLVWSNLMDYKRVIKSIFHWHTLPVADVAFSTEGCYFYSGGGEATLVKWNIFQHERSFLPRLGAPIHRLNVSPDNTYVVSAHDDNSLQIINSQRVVVQVIQALTQGCFQGAKSKNLLPTGLLYDSLSKSLVLNGRPGHLQFYSVHEDKQLFNLDIAGRNFVSGERESVVLNTDVQKAAIDDKGSWLAAVEYWNDEKTSAQIWLKFWEFDVSKQNYVLNTNVTLPHTKEINCIVFRPSASSDDLPLAITTSNDCQFKVWVLKEDACYADKLSWTCKSMGCYRDLPPGNACFSEDGSLLAVAFGKVATLWTVDNITLKKVLVNHRASNLNSKSDIKQLVFGRQSCSHLLVCQDGTSLTVWNVLSLSIMWTVCTGVQFVVADIMSDMVAVFCQDQTLVVFKPDNPEPVHSVEIDCESQIIAAIFVPTKDPSEGTFTEKSQLFFFDADQNLLTLTGESVEMESAKVQKVSQHLPVTPFGKLQAESQVSSVKVFEQVQMDIPTVTNQELEISCPTQMDPVALCSKVLKSLLIKKKCSYEKSIYNLDLLTLPL